MQNSKAPQANQYPKKQTAHKIQSSLNMPTVYFSQRALSDLERMSDFLIQEAPTITTGAANDIVDTTSHTAKAPLDRLPCWPPA